MVTPCNRSVVQDINGADRGAVQDFQKIVLTCYPPGLSRGFGYDAVSQLGVVVLLRQVAEKHIAQPLMKIVCQHTGTSLVALMPARGENTLLQIGRVRTFKQHLLVVIGLDDKVVGCADSLFDLVVRRATIGDEHEAFPHIIDGIAQAIGGVVRDSEGVDPHTKEFERLTFFEETACGLEFERDAIVAVDAGVDGCSGVDGDMDMLSKPSDGADMVGMVVRDEDSHDVGEVEFHRAKTVVNLTRRDTGIDEDALVFGSEVVAIAGAT